MVVLDKRVLFQQLRYPLLTHAPVVQTPVASRIEAVFDLVSTQGTHRFIGLNESTFSVWSHSMKQYDYDISPESCLFSRNEHPPGDAISAFGIFSSEYELMLQLSKKSS